MKKLFCIFMSTIIIFSATSCKGVKQEVEKLAVVLAIGFDLTPENKYLVTVQILNPQENSSQSTSSKKGGGQDPSSEVLIFSSEGDTPLDAINRLSIDYGRNLYFGHSDYLVIGKNLAESGLSLLVDAILRGYETRPDNTLLLAKDKASKILAFKPIDEPIPSNSVKKLITLQSIRGFSPVVTRLDFASTLSSKTTAPIMGIIDISKDNNIGNTFKLAGTGVFEKDKLIGYLDINETRGMQWIRGKVKNGNITVTTPDNSKVTFSIINGSSKIKSSIENDSVTIEITIKSQSNILEMPGKLDPMKDPKIMDDLAKLQSEAIENEVKLALNAAQKKLNADIFDFGGLIHREHPAYWKKTEDNWNHIFPNIKVNVNVDSSLKGPGVISKPIK
ncbi:Ger(x)C family spore germination protein [Clostridium magnum]|uniref:Spore germination protein B3 n=1 Tax=Clostridium magnum DSM 2767 TaxID=1121326 RepID=A0A161WS46_9CLOT|nr:Ger(x)C family spore germination protein [Clostridium magnum]KZL89608.1 spore germination protein B3 precursor [Clostridium magnum DSM 2767]SHH73993.1 spore germination protein KC [Clostridium magnum DSM 2767]